MIVHSSRQHQYTHRPTAKNPVSTHTIWLSQFHAPLARNRIIYSSVESRPLSLARRRGLRLARHPQPYRLPATKLQFVGHIDSFPTAMIMIAPADSSTACELPHCASGFSRASISSVLIITRVHVKSHLMHGTPACSLTQQSISHKAHHTTVTASSTSSGDDSSLQHMIT